MHGKAIKRILGYLKGTIDHGLLLHQPSSLDLIGYSDVDWGTDSDDRRSTLGYCIFLGRNLISWSSKKQQIVSQFFSKVEYRSLANVTAKILWLQSLLSKLQIQPSRPPLIWCII